jgi:hypothetical protein
MEHRPDQFTHYACQTAYLNLVMGETVLPDQAEDRDSGGNG